MMTKRQKQVAIAAGPVFLGQGFTRTTMADIAIAAELSRQGLYLIFPNKEAVFEAAVRALTDTVETRLRQDLPQHEHLRSKLSFVCEEWLGQEFDLQRSTPDARDMDNLAFPVVREVYQRLVSLIAGLIEDACGKAFTAKETVHLARVLVFGVRGYGATAVDGADMRRLTALQIELLVGHVETTMAAQDASQISRGPRVGAVKA